MIVRPALSRGEGIPSAELLYSCVQEHEGNLTRLVKLREYYQGKHQVMNRRRMSGLPNNALVHGFPRYICVMTSGYLIGQPIAYQAPGQEAALEKMQEAFRRTDMDSVDAELARDAAIYGKGVELIYSDGQGRPRSAAVSPEEAFVVYEDSVEAQPMLGIRGVPVLKADGTPEGWQYQVYTRQKKLTYRIRERSLRGFEKPAEEQRHFFGQAPMVEYWNGEDERGDFENAISLIDAYDLLQSDRLNDKQQFVDALLVLYGCTLEPDEAGRSPGRQLREDKAIALPDGDARVEWLCKQMNEADTEVLKNALNADIHKMCMVPDMTDLNFAGNSSGVAMRYKLLGLEQLTRIKERWFREGLMQRIRLYAGYLQLTGMPEMDADAVRPVFTRALPVNELEIAQTISQLRGLVEDEKLLRKAEASLGV